MKLEKSARSREVEFDGLAMFEEDEVEFAWLSENEPIFGRELIIGIAHFPEGDVVILEKAERKGGLFPHFFANAVVLTGKVTVGMGITKIPFDARSSGEEISPKGIFSGIVTCRIFGIWNERVGSITRLIDGDDPRFPCLHRAAEVVQSGTVDMFKIHLASLQRKPSEW